MKPKFPRGNSVNYQTLKKVEKGLSEGINQSMFDSILLGKYISGHTGIIVNVIRPRPLNNNNLVVLQNQDLVIAENNELAWDDVIAYLDDNSSYRLPTLTEWKEIYNNRININLALISSDAAYDYIYDNREPEALYWVGNSEKVIDGVRHAMVYDSIYNYYFHMPIEGDGEGMFKARLLKNVNLSFVPDYSTVVTIESTSEDVTVDETTPPEGYLGIVSYTLVDPTVTDLLAILQSTDETAEPYIGILDGTTEEEKIGEALIVENDIVFIIAEDNITTGRYLISNS